MSHQKVLWIVENWTKEPSYQEMKQAIKDEEQELLEVFDYKKGDYFQAQDRERPSVFLGSIGMTKHFLKDFPFVTVFCSLEKYYCSRYYPFFGDLLFNDKYTLVPLKDFRRQRFMFYSLFGKDCLIFVRPDSGDKPFQAQLVDMQDLDQFYSNNSDEMNNLVLLSTPKNIQWEGRFVVTKDKEIIAHSTYRFQGQITNIPAVPVGATKKCKEILEVGYYPDDVFCIDLVQDNDGDFYLMELTSFSSAGLYASDKRAIVKRVSEILNKQDGN